MRRWEPSLLAAFGLTCTALASAAPGYGTAEFTDRRDPPPYLTLTPEQRELYDLGHAIFNTQWVKAGTRNADRRDGLGPLFNASNCDACHNEGARGQGLTTDGVAPAGLVIQLSKASADTSISAGDRVYGHVLNANAIEGFAADAVVNVRYQERAGRYPDGKSWSLRQPLYEFSALRHGPLAASIIIKPRLASAPFGAGLIEAVPTEAIVTLSRAQRDGVTGRVPWKTVNGKQVIGRFGWQSDAISIEDQTARALSREMGLTSRDIVIDDCGPQDRECLTAAGGGRPEVSDKFMAALVAFQRWIAVPRAPVNQPRQRNESALFAAMGCAACHQPQLPLSSGAGARQISAYTDLLLHDLGPTLADRRAGGEVVPSLWRTAPLWGLAHITRSGRALTLLHDGRARSVQEAILWHGGEAAAARSRFERLPQSDRDRLSAWVESL